jgi:D-aspartate ligase
MRQTVQNPGAVLLGSDFKALGVARSLGRRGIPCVVIDRLPRSAWYSRYVTRRFVWPDALDAPSLVPYLLDLAHAEDLEHWVLVPMQDEVVELVARHADQLSAAFRLATQDWAIVRWAGDKRLLHAMAEAVGVPAPRTWYPKTLEDLDALPIEYPVIVKPAISVHLQYALRIKALPAQNPAELRCQYERAAGIMSPEEIMVQEIIPGGGSQQYSVASYCKDGAPIVRMTARRMRQYPIDYGLGSSFVRAVEVPELFEPAERLTGYMRVTGMVEVEFKQDPRDGQYKLLDINVRPWGWHSLGQACGLDFPFIQYCDLLGQCLAPATPRYGHQWVRLLTDLPAGYQEIRAGTLSPLEYASSLVGRTTFSVLDWRDPFPAVGDLASALVRAIKGSHAGATVGAAAPPPDPETAEPIKVFA